MHLLQNVCPHLVIVASQIVLKHIGHKNCDKFVVVAFLMSFSLFIFFRGFKSLELLGLRSRLCLLGIFNAIQSFRFLNDKFMDVKTLIFLLNFFFSTYLFDFLVELLKLLE